MESKMVCEILPNLYLGVVESRSFPMSAMGMDVVVDCISETDNPILPLLEDNYIYIFCPFQDGSIPSNIKDLEQIARIINSYFKDKKVLIRCYGGRNRSAFLMALVLIDQNYSPQEAIDLIIQKRTGYFQNHKTNFPCTVFHNQEFKQYLLNVDIA